MTQTIGCAPICNVVGLVLRKKGPGRLAWEPTSQTYRTSWLSQVSDEKERQFTGKQFQYEPGTISGVGA